MNLTATASVTVAVPVAQAWDALVNPETIKRYMFGTTVTSTWREGAPIIWQGEWKGKAYQDKGTVVQIKPPHLLQVTHFSPLSGAPDVPESYHTVTYELSAVPGGTVIRLSQGNNPTEEARAHSEENWSTILNGLKKSLEG